MAVVKVIRVTCQKHTICNHINILIYRLRNTSSLTKSEREILHEPSDMVKLRGHCVGKTKSTVQILDKFSAACCVCGQVWTSGTVLCLWQAAWRPAGYCELFIQTWIDNMKLHLTSNMKMPKCILYLVHIISAVCTFNTLFHITNLPV